MTHKRKLTLFIDKNIIMKSKEKAHILGISLSRLVENALRFFVKPVVYCFCCGAKFEVRKADTCPRCGWFICPKCGGCGCKLGDEGRRVAFYFRETFREIFGMLEFLE